MKADLSAKDALNKAADYIQKHGHSRTSSGEGPGQALCVILAIAEVNGGRCHDDAERLFMRSLRLEAISGWNDEHTKREVVAAMRKAAK